MKAIKYNKIFLIIILVALLSVIFMGTALQLNDKTYASGSEDKYYLELDLFSLGDVYVDLPNNNIGFSDSFLFIPSSRKTDVVTLLFNFYELNNNLILSANVSCSGSYYAQGYGDDFLQAKFSMSNITLEIDEAKYNQLNNSNSKVKISVYQSGAAHKVESVKGGIFTGGFKKDTDKFHLSYNVYSELSNVVVDSVTPDIIIENPIEPVNNSLSDIISNLGGNDNEEFNFMQFIKNLLFNNAGVSKAVTAISWIALAVVALISIGILKLFLKLFKFAFRW